MEDYLTMMTTKNNIIRVSDDRAQELLKDGFKYIPKSEWKEKVRDVKKSAEEKPPEEKNNKMSRAAKRHLRKSK